ncbi:hypothetical protein [Streptomyces sp. NPDC008139]|uniref:hypothetical protein n=1 Tax=Streptomyces sp. NPDC008139 TaxID=3364814 RepID=UPI0036E5BEF1
MTVCHSPASVPAGTASSLNPDASLGRLAVGVFVGVIRPALSPHDMMRLRGCLSDASVNRAHAKVLGTGHAGAPH